MLVKGVPVSKELGKKEISLSLKFIKLYWELVSKIFHDKFARLTEIIEKKNPRLLYMCSLFFATW